MYEIKSKSESSCCQDFTIEMKFETSFFLVWNRFFSLEQFFSNHKYNCRNSTFVLDKKLSICCKYHFILFEIPRVLALFLF